VRFWQDGGDGWCNGGGLFALAGEKLKHMEVLADLYRMVAMLRTGLAVARRGEARNGQHDPRCPHQRGGRGLMLMIMILRSMEYLWSIILILTLWETSCGTAQRHVTWRQTGAVFHDSFSGTNALKRGQWLEGC
jgi:hypothetical protein